MRSPSKDLTAALADLERQVKSQGAKLDGHAQQIEILFEKVREIIEPPISPRKRIGFSSKHGDSE